MDRWAQLVEAVEPHRRRVLDHEVYKRLDDRRALAVFMEHHVWAVWDFMSLVTALQQRLTCTTVPWRPMGLWAREAARLVNEVKLCEESDHHPNGGHASHLAMYVEAMHEVGANTAPLRAFLAALEVNDDVRVASLASACGAPDGAARFIDNTLHVAVHGSLPDVAAVFAVGREQLIPDLFAPLLDVHGFPMLRYYLERHVEVDGEEHGPAARQLVELLVGHRDEAWQLARSAAVGAVAARHRLWDDAVHAIEGDGV